LAKQVWYALEASSVVACTRWKSASYTSTSVSHNAAHEERILKPGMAEVGDEPAKASRTAHLAHVDA
jgi:hypothetical protein